MRATAQTPAQARRPSESPRGVLPIVCWSSYEHDGHMDTRTGTVGRPAIVRSLGSRALLVMGSVLLVATLVPACTDDASSTQADPSEGHEALQDPQPSGTDDLDGLPDGGSLDTGTEVDSDEPGRDAIPQDDGAEGAGDSGDLQLGDRFEDTCTIAWPTAPSRSSQGTQIRTTCAGVDTSEFQFVDILVLDPDLEVTPSSSTVHVSGEIVDIIDSDMGFRTLAVIAEDAELR